MRKGEKMLECEVCRKKKPSVYEREGSFIGNSDNYLIYFICDECYKESEKGGK